MYIYVGRPRARKITYPTEGVANAFVSHVYVSVSRKFTDQSLHGAITP